MSVCVCVHAFVRARARMCVCVCVCVCVRACALYFNCMGTDRSAVYSLEQISAHTNGLVEVNGFGFNLRSNVV